MKILQSLPVFLLVMGVSSYAGDYVKFSCPAGQKIVTEEGSQRSISREIPAEWFLADQSQTDFCFAYQTPRKTSPFTG